MTRHVHEAPSSPAARAADASPAPRQRIAKLMARAGLCSRRDAEAWILDGRVSVNGTVLTSPALDVASTDQILVDGTPLPTIERTRLFLFHKPRGLVTSDHDPEGRATVAGFLRDTWTDGPRVVTVGRLDINTEGLLLLTNDGGLARVLELPQTGWVRRYRVRAKGTPDVAALEALAAGVTIDGIDYAGIEAKLDRTQGSNCWLTMGLREGKNREIKRVLEHIGLEVNRLIRLSFGPFQLQDLPEGRVEEIRPRVLRDQLGAKLAAQAGVTFDEPAPATEPKPARTERRPSDRATEKRATPERATDERAQRPGRRDAPAREGRPPRTERSTRFAPREADAPKRERPAAGTRKHVSALRSDDAKSSREGPRRRIERSDAQVTGDRTVVVERMVSVPPRVKPTGRGRPSDGASRRSGGEGASHRGGGDGGPKRGGDRQPARHGSPSAAGKRERIARSGGERADRARDTRRDERPQREDRATRDTQLGRSRPDRAVAGRGDTRPSRAPGRERGAREADREDRRETRSGPRDRQPKRDAGRGERPRSDRPRDTGARSATPRDATARDGKPRDAKPRSDKPRGGKPRDAKPRGTRAGKPGAGGSRRPAGDRPRGPSKPRR